jgi:hypothetical protein
MQHYVILDNQSLDIINEEAKDLALTRGAKILFEGTKKECDKHYDELVEEWGYTGPIWEKLELNTHDT